MNSAPFRALPLRWIAAAMLFCAGPPIASAQLTPNPSPTTPPAATPPAATAPVPAVPATPPAVTATPAKPATSLSPAMQAEGNQALAFILKHEVVDPNAIVRGTGQPLASRGVWAIGKQRPASCPQPPAPAKTAAITSPAANPPAAAPNPSTPNPATPNPSTPNPATPQTTAPQSAAPPSPAPTQPVGPPCVLIVYHVAGTPVSAEWVVLLQPDGINGTILEQNSDSIHYMLRIVPTAEAARLVVARQTELNSRSSPRLAGVVEVGLIISTTGEPSRIFPISGPEELRLPALTIARQWIFRPLTIGNRPIPYETVIKFTFGNGKVKTEP